MWRIDAAEVDLDDIYSQEEQVIEVSFDDDLGSGDVEVTFDEFHHAAVEDSMASDEDAPVLHPARALATDAQGQPEVAQMIDSAFSHMGNSAWIEAAQVLSSASSMRQNDPSILNNLGLALLQSALEMDSHGDPMSSSQYEAAIMALRQGAKIEPENSTLLLNLGHALLVSGRAEKALGVISVVRGREPSNVEIENALGACLIQLGRDEEAESILTPYANDSIVSANIALI
jgi:Flp pilus assembly protein TadD